MDPQLLAFQQAALADAVTTMGRVVTFAGTPYTGIRTELEVEPGKAESGGFKFKRAFAIRFNNPALTATIKPGMTGVDDTGVACKVVSFKKDHLGVRYFMGSVNA
jgi:hypothetical protein